jgi:exonuclease SbcC
MLRLLGDQDRSAARLETLRTQRDCADRLLLDLRGRLLDLRERRLAGLAAELATGLDAGDPCPVCGSCVHPVPAMTTDAVSPADVLTAESDQSRAAESLSLLSSAISAEQAGWDARAVELATHAGGGDAGGFGEQPMPATPEVVAALAAVTAHLAEAQQAVSALPEAQAQMAALTTEVERIQGLFEAAVAAKTSSTALAASSLVQSQTARAEVTKLLASHGELCPCQPGEHSGVGLVISRHRQTLAELRALAAGLQELVTHRASRHDAGLRLSTALRASGLDSLEQAQAVALSPARVAELSTFLRNTERARAQATALLAQADVVAALELPTPDVDALTEQAGQAAEALTSAGRRHTLSEQAQRELRVLSRTVHQALADLGPAQAEAQLVQELADCLAGTSADNALRMRLSSYVLAARLAEIATLANERLTTMSDGRYSLEYTDARAAKGARSGLGLLVRDAWTGQTRETSSLSGGESFMASLALALGMGDAVRAEAGGFDLQTLFVDEGFGSLDEESLEQVIAVLDTLRAGGRAVGIVSHVTELRTRIPHQLQVLKQQAGSRIRIENRNCPAA